MNATFDPSEMNELLGAAREGAITDAEHARLNELLSRSKAARQRYVRYTMLCADLLETRSAEGGSSTDAGDVRRALAEQDAMILPGEFAADDAPPTAPLREVARTVEPTRAAPLAVILRTMRGPRRWVLAAAALCVLAVGIGLIVWHQTGPSVATLTFSADARWAAGESSPTTGESLNSGVRNLEQGVVRLRFANGAEVLVIAPARFDPVARDAVRLLQGKLFARAPAEAHGFTVHTPAADVVDLGTEFGVLVEPSGGTEAHVLAGEVRLVPHDATFPARQLTVNTAARVEADGKQVVSIAARPGDFSSPLAFIDLVDVVAGGDGRGTRRNQGIDAASGQIILTSEKNRSLFNYVASTGFRRVNDLTFVDGVAVVNFTGQPMQLDSAGHTFSDFGKTIGSAFGPVWAGGTMSEFPGPSISTTFDGKIDYAVAPNGLIELIPNKLITFDLDAMRRSYPQSLSVFRSVAGVTPSNQSATQRRVSGRADIWVFVDGELHYSRRGVNDSNGPQTIEVPISSQARFLTLAATDRTGPPHFDWVLFGNPRIELGSR